MSQFLEIDGLAMHVMVAGPPSAPPLLLIHSLGASTVVWEAQAAALARGFRVIRYDLRGHGLSEAAGAGGAAMSIERFAADALALLDVLGVASAHVAGISIGGMIAQAMAAAAPARVRSLMLCDTALAIPPPELWRQRAATVRAQGLAALAEQVTARWASPAYLASATGRGLRAMLLRTSVEGYAAAAEALAVADLSSVAPTIAAAAIPTMVLVGERDPSTPLASSVALAAALGAGEPVVIPGALHLPITEHAEAVTAAMLAFLTPRDAEAGARVRAEVLGEAHVARVAAAVTDLDRDFVAYLTRAAWGEVWARPHWDLRTRSVVTLAILAALGREHELALHVRAMTNTGATVEDLRELLLHVAVYAGIPAANAAMRVAKQTLAEQAASGGSKERP